MGFFYKSRTFIPIAHEKVIVLGGFKSLTWQQLVMRVLSTLGNGETQATLNTIYGKVEKHPKVLTNPTWKATVRRTNNKVK